MGFNAKHAKSVSKADWVKQHEHHKDEFDLSAEYDKMVPPKEKVEKSKEPEKKEEK